MVCLKVKNHTKIIKYQFNSVCLYYRLVKAMCQIVLFTLIYHQTWAHSSIKINILPFYLLSIFLLSRYCAGSPYRIPISSAILQLQEAGRLHILKNRWWKEKSPKQCNVRSDLPIVPSLDYFCIIFRSLVSFHCLIMVQNVYLCFLLHYLVFLSPFVQEATREITK